MISLGSEMCPDVPFLGLLPTCLKWHFSYVQGFSSGDQQVQGIELLNPGLGGSTTDCGFCGPWGNAQKPESQDQAQRPGRHTQEAKSE